MSIIVAIGSGETYILFFLYGLVVLGLLSSCSGGKFWDPADARTVPSNVDERVRKNLEEGKGFSIKKLQTSGSGGAGMGEFIYGKGKDGENSFRIRQGDGGSGFLSLYSSDPSKHETDTAPSSR